MSAGVVHLSTFDSLGGAAIAASRLHEGLLQVGFPSKMIVRQLMDKKTGVEELKPLGGWAAILRRQWHLRTRFIPWERRCRRRKPNTDEHLHPYSWSPYELALAVEKASVVHVHWAYSLLDWPSILGWRKRPPIVITTHDLHPMTGGCVYPQGCTNYQEKCGHCPQLLTSSAKDSSYQILGHKLDILQRYGPDRIRLIATNQWMTNLARSSSMGRLCEVVEIPHVLPLSAYLEANREVSREHLGIPKDVPVVLGLAHGLSTPRKGWDVFLRIIAILVRRIPNLWILTAGDLENCSAIPGNHRHLGFLKGDIAVAEAMAAADVFINPVREETFGQTVVECMAAGTVVVTCDHWGPSALIKHQETGLLCPVGDSSAFADTIHSLLLDPARASVIAKAAREKTGRDYEIAPTVQRYADLYNDLTHGQWLQSA